MDDIMVFDRALSEQELGDIYSDEDDYSQIAWWPLHMDGKDQIDDANGLLKNETTFPEDVE